MINFAVENTARLKLYLHLAVAFFLLVAFTLTIARVANKGSARGRSTSYGIPVTIKSAIFLAYQYTTDHCQRLRRWRSLKAYMILNYVEMVFWAMLFGLSAQGSVKGCRGSACTLAGILAAVSFFGCIAAALLAFVCTKAWLFTRRHGYEPGAKPEEKQSVMESKGSVVEDEGASKVMV